MIKKLVLFTLILSSSSLFLSCATARFTATGKTFPPSQETVKVYFSNVPDSLKYSEIGIVSSQGGQIHQAADMIHVMQKKAAKYGANAIVIVSNESEQHWQAMANNLVGAYAGSTVLKNMVAIAIRIK